VTALSDLWALIVDNHRLFLRGASTTIELLLLSSAFAFLLAVPLALARVARASWLRVPAYGFTYVFRGTPLLTQLFLVYYGLGQSAWIQSSSIWPLLHDAFPCALIVMSLNMSAYLAESLRGGIQGVPAGEREAAVAMGMGPWQLNRRIILPRALGIALPTLGNELIIQLKATALVGTIALLDMTHAARQIEKRTYTTEPLLVAAIFYVTATWAIGRGFRLIERRMNRHLR
jgi:polar amino acid transport system permease protein